MPRAADPLRPPPHAVQRMPCTNAFECCLAGNSRHLQEPVMEMLELDVDWAAWYHCSHSNPYLLPRNRTPKYLLSARKHTFAAPGKYFCVFRKPQRFGDSWEGLQYCSCSLQQLPSHSQFFWKRNEVDEVKDDDAATVFPPQQHWNPDAAVAVANGGILPHPDRVRWERRRSCCWWWWPRS